MRRAPLRFGPLLALVFVSMLVPLGAHAQDPDFSTTTDILNGQRRMLRADDLALVYQDPAQQAPYANDEQMINTNTPIIRRASIRRERVESQKGRLKPWQ